MRPMLAKPYSEKLIKLPGFVQPKLDGVRLIWTGEKALSRTGKNIEGLPLLIEELSDLYLGIPLDGELYKHGSSFQSFLGSIRRSKNIEEDLYIGYHIYDMPLEDSGFVDRLEALNSLVVSTDRINLVNTYSVVNTEEIETHYTNFMSDGYEGLIFRTKNGPYKFGKRSSDLVKYKAFQDDEFLITGIKPLVTYDKVIVPEGAPGAKRYSDGRWYKNENPQEKETTGAILCVTADGQPFDAGSGLDDQTRALFWKNPPIGKIATIQYFGLTDAGKPRHPVFVAIRDYE